MFKNKFFVSFVLVLAFLFLFSLSSVSADEYYFNSGNITNESFQGVIDNSTPDEVIINLDDGEYSLGQINVTRNATIVGNSSGNVKINGSGILFNITSSNVRLINLTITGYTSAIVGNSSGLMVIGNNITTSGVSINLSSSGSANPITGVVIEDNIIDSSESSDASGAVSLFGDSSDKTIFDVLFRGNNITSISSGVYLGDDSYNSVVSSANLIFENNNITGTSGHGVALDASSSNNTNITFANNNITGTYNGVSLSASSSNNTNITFSSNNTNITFANNNITGTYASGVSLGASSSNNTNITFANNNITGTYGVDLYASSSNNTNITFANNNITGTSLGVYLEAYSSNNTNITFANNNITGTSGHGVALDASSSNNTNITFANNNITGTYNGVELYASSSNNTNITFANNNITGTYGVALDADSSNNTNITFANNNIIGVYYGVYVRSNDGNISGVMFLNNTINATGGSGFYFVNEDSGAINVTDFIIKGNNIFATNAGLDFSGLKSGSLVNVTVEYNRIIANTGVNITDFDNGSSFDYNWWGVNDITGKTLGINTLNHYILNITNLTSLDNLRFGDNVSFAFLVLNTSLINTGVENLPYFEVNGTYNNQTFVVDNVSNFTGDWAVSLVGDNVNVFAATLDSQDDSLTFSASKADTNSTIIVDDVQIGTNAVITGQLDNYTGNGSDLLNVTVDNNLYENVIINSTGGWNLTYLTNRTGNITVTVTYLGNDNFTGFINSTSFDVLKNSTNSTIDVSGDFKVSENISISGILADEDSDPINNVQITVTVGNETFNVTTNSSGDWSLVYAPIHGGEFLILVNWAGNDNYTGFTNNTSFNVTKLASNSSIILPGTVKFNQSVLIFGVLSDENNNSIAGAVLEVIVFGESFNVTTDSVGVWSLNYTPDHSGVFDLSLIYLGDGLYDGFVENKTFNVSKLVSNSSIVIPGDVKLDETITISGKVYDENNNVLGNIQLNITVDGKPYRVTTDSVGFWSLKYKPTRTGQNSVKVVFNGNTGYFGFVNGSSFNVSLREANIKLQAVSKTIRSFGSGKKLARFKYSFRNFGGKVGSKTYEFKINSRYTLQTPKITKNIKYSYNNKTRILKVVVKNLNTDVAVISYIIKRNKPVYNGRNIRVSRYTYNNYHPKTVTKAYTVKTVKSHKITKIKVTKNTAYVKKGITVFSIAESLKTNQKTQTIVYSKKKA
ncbi:right-handed parallel beta-helix repeat-containing protein [Methanobrevibacter arboriphilus]|uniref:beta strand repeat-containing protein n=1 Tax=Methanobrevibacter arboriphilus TaxID=39441 RepID=UPI0005B2937F|nr:right-handed parallel beta-helix repeat-containing protein [Methanobrevibacter arboriphilus]